jgi:hypothetical protein
MAIHALTKTRAAASENPSIMNYATEKVPKALPRLLLQSAACKVHHWPCPTVSFYIPVDRGYVFRHMPSLFQYWNQVFTAMHTLNATQSSSSRVFPRL